MVQQISLELPGGAGGQQQRLSFCARIAEHGSEAEATDVVATAPRTNMAISLRKVPSM
jgi:hypothetical protein